MTDRVSDESTISSVMPAKPRIYIETSVVSYLTARPSRDVLATSRQQLTLAWWKTELPNYTAVISREVLREATRGNEEAAKRRLDVLEEIFVLQETPEVLTLENALVAGKAIPKKAKEDARHLAMCAVNSFRDAGKVFIEDARHLAMCAVNRIPFLVTWNFKHISNPQMWDCMRRICAQHGHPFSTIIRPD